MDLSNRAVRPPASVVGRKSIARIGDRRTGRTLRRPRRGMAGGMDGGHGLLVVRRLKAELKEIR